MSGAGGKQSGNQRGKPRFDERYEKPSKHKQWQERAERPIASRPMGKEEIEEHRMNLVRSYGCENSDLTYGFQKIVDENDEDRDDCIWLKYKMKCIVAGKPQNREVFAIKLPIPDEIRRMADEMRKKRSTRTPAKRKPMRALPAPTKPLMSKLPNKNTSVANIADSITVQAGYVAPTGDGIGSQSSCLSDPVVEELSSVIPTTRPKLRKPVRK